MNQARYALLITAMAAALMLAGCQASGKVSPAAASVQPEPPEKHAVETVNPVVQRLDLTVTLPGELQPYEDVTIYPKVTGFVQTVLVDLGSKVTKGEMLAHLVAPEIVSQKTEAEANLRNARNREVAAQAKAEADEGTYQRLKAAAATPGVISGQELDIAQKAAEADRASAQAMRESVLAAEETVHSTETLAGYLDVVAPFDGVITERDVHPGALVGPSSGRRTQTPLFRLVETSRLRLVVAAPESYVGGIVPGASLEFTVPAFPSRTFKGTVARIAPTLDQQTRTMPVELDVWNPDDKLHPGMFPKVSWRVQRSETSMFVPQSAILRNMEVTYVIRIRDGRCEWVKVTLGATSGNLVEIFGAVDQHDEIAARATEELRPDTTVVSRPAAPPGPTGKS